MERVPRKSRMRPNRLWRLWKKPSWEAKRLVLDRKRREQRKLRAVQQQLPDDVLAEHIFSKLSLQTLLPLRLTCKRWNRVIRRVFDSIGPRQSLVHILYRRSRNTTAVAHNPSTPVAVWRPIWWPRTPTGLFYQVDGPFVVHVDEYYPDGVRSPARSHRRSRVFTVHNLLTKEYHVVSEPIPACSESEKRRSDLSLTLFGATKEDYKALMLTVITSLKHEDPTTYGTGYFYTHLYTSATDTWKHINCTSLTNWDLGYEVGLGLPHIVQFVDGCFDGRFVFLTCEIHYSKENALDFRKLRTEVRLWAFHLQQQSWTRIPTDMYGSQPFSPGVVDGMVRNSKYVTCMGKLLAVVTDVTARINWEDIADGKPMGRVTIFQLFGFPQHGVHPQYWKEISRMPSELMLCFNEIELDDNYVVNEVIYFHPMAPVCHGGLRTRFAVLYNFRDNSWKKVIDSSNTVCSFGNDDSDVHNGDDPFEYYEDCVSVASELVNYLPIN